MGKRKKKDEFIEEKASAEEIKELEEEIEDYNKMLEETNIIEEEEQKEELDEEIDNYNELINEKDNENTRVNNNKEIYKKTEHQEEDFEEKEERLSRTTRIISNSDKYEEEENFLDEKKSNKKKVIIIILIILLVIGIGVGGYFFYTKYKKETVKVEKEKTYSEKEMKKILNNYGEALENVIGINLEKKEELLSYEDAVDLLDFDEEVICKTKEIYEDGKVYLNDCTIDDHKTKASYGEVQEKVETEEDGTFNVYVKDKVATLEEPENKDEYTVYKITTNTEPSEIKLLSNYNPKYVSYADSDYNMHLKVIKTNKDAVLLSNVTSVIPIYNSYEGGYDTTYVNVIKNGKSGIYNLNTGMLDVKLIYDSMDVNLNYGITGPTTQITTLNKNNIVVRKDNKTGVIKYKTGEVVIPIEYDTMLRSGNYLFVYNYDSKMTDKTIYDFDGNKYLEDQYDDLYGIVDGKYVLVKDNDDIKLIKLDGKVLYNYGSIKNLGEMYYFISYNDEPLFQFEDTSNNKCIEVAYDTSTKKGTHKSIECGGIAKPILYMYPEETTNVKVTFDHPELLNTTYPKYNKSWDVTVDSDSNITDKNGKKYYALYWDEKLVNKVDFSEGFYVTKNNAIKFLEEKLFEIGLTDREANEFIMYWLPVLEKNKKSLVYFELTKERNKYNKINIDPEPDSILRVAIHIKKVNKKTKIKEQNLTHFERSGFTVVEWGGTNY